RSSRRRPRAPGSDSRPVARSSSRFAARCGSTASWTSARRSCSSCPSLRAESPDMAKARILVVDDEAGMLRSMERILAPQHDVVPHRVPDEALAAAREEGFDVAILDVRMPGMDGFDLMA